jgi:hypothetical protein
LREGSEHAFHQLAGRCVVDRFRRGSERNPKRLEMRTERKVVVLLAGEPGEVVYDHEVDLALARPAVLQQGLELRPFGRLRTLAFFVEAFEDFVTVPPAVLLAGPQLRGQTQVLGLFLRADANVDHRADHLWQLKPITGRRQAVSLRHGR